jgi:hypothetical protein
MIILVPKIRAIHMPPPPKTNKMAIFLKMPQTISIKFQYFMENISLNKTA